MEKLIKTSQQQQSLSRVQKKLLKMKILRKDRAPKIEPHENKEKPVADFEKYQKLFDG